jgi:signal transduction histidine kinase/CheY-like chemotaxis protein
MRRSGAISLRIWLLYVALAGGVAALLVAGVAGWISWREQKAEVGLSFLATSRAMIGAVDRELDQAVALARGLAVSRSLAEGDTAAFDAQARQALAPYGYGLILNSADSGVQLVNTQVPAGSALPALPVDRALIDPAAQGGKIAVKPLRQSRISGAWVTVVQVPVASSGGDHRYVMDIVIPSSNFQRIIDEQRLPQNWNTVIVDGDWTVVARLVSPEKFVGREAATRQLQNLAEPDTIYETHVLEGDLSLSALSRSKRYRWAAAISMPEGDMFRQVRGPVLLTALGGFVGAAAAIGAVAFFIGRLIGGIQALAAATGALGRNEAVELPPLPVRELQLVGEALVDTAAKLQDQTRLLEARVAEAARDLRHEAEERRKAEADLAHAQRLESLGQLTGGVAHDFNNLLTVVSGNLELAEARATSQELKRLLRNAQNGAARGARLVQSLLAFARKQSLKPETVNPNWLIKEFAPVLNGAAGDAVQLQLLLSPTLHPCRIDPAQFQSALLNLVTNACAAMPSGGRITIETENVELDTSSDAAAALPSGTYIRITVSDTGMGMTAAVAARAFEPFFTTKDVGKGSGLGLSQVYGFVKQSGGHAEMASEIDIGTRVQLYLPRSLEKERDAHGSDSQRIRLEPGHGTVMVVDDDVHVRAVLVAYLEDIGYRVLVAGDGPEALAAIERGEHVDVVLTDYLMPSGMTGTELGRRIVALEPDIKVVVISGNFAAQAADQEPDFPLLLKPIRQAELGRAIREALGR